MKNLWTIAMLCASAYWGCLAMGWLERTSGDATLAFSMLAIVLLVDALSEFAGA